MMQPGNRAREPGEPGHTESTRRILAWFAHWMAATPSRVLMRRAIVVAAVVAVAGCHRSQLQVVSPTLTAQPMRIAMPADTGFVRRTCVQPDSVLAGTRPCYEKEQKSHLRVF